MTRAGEKLYRDTGEADGSLLLAIVRHPSVRLGSRRVTRFVVLVALVGFALGLA